MACIRLIKKDIDYLVEEVISDSYLSIYFHPEKKDEIITVMEEAVQLRNSLIHRVNNPAEKHNSSLIKKHFDQIRRDLIENIDNMFVKLSALCK